MDITHDFFLIAGDSFLAFNEYLQLITETGIVGMLFFLIFNIIILTYSNSYYTDLILMSKLTIIVLLSSAFTSYPLHVNALLYLYFTCCGFILSLMIQDFSKKNNFKTSYIKYIIMGIGIYIFTFSLSETKKIKKWENIFSTNAVINEQVINQYWGLYDHLKYNSKFLLHFGSILIHSNENAEVRHGIKMVEKSKENFFSYQTMEILSAGYEKIGIYSVAISYASDLTYYIPSKFGSRLKLILLYDKAGQKERCEQEIKFALKMPIKVHSNEVAQIKNEMLKLLNKCQ